ncbi:MAG: hypothetical protein RMI00_06455 [Sulfolobales archaeon]|nr:hypothetical protein [Sulfolobales archaeon]
MADPLAKGRHKAELKGKRQAKARGIRGYRVIQPKPGVYVRIALTEKRGPRGGRSVATSIIREKRRLKKTRRARR